MRVLAVVGGVVAFSGLTLPAVTVSETLVERKTYPYSDPDPVPATSEKRYPYFRFDGTTTQAVNRAWRTVELESDRMVLTFLPDLGGKLWGATDRRSGRDFIYRNDVVKFRNVAIRGPWSSGGIEFNFGIIGHSPTTVSPVDWCVRTNADASVSYYCSDTEAIAGTTWQVEVCLRDGEEHFTMRTKWFNASDIPQPYYHWMNAAFSTRGDPMLNFPGDFQVGHEGDAHPWPVNEVGRAVNVVGQNDFGGNKSYHVVGGDPRFFGVWWCEWGLGAYHWCDFGEKYGRKAWIWALSREGGIWEDLLTDRAGQYMELQSGRGFNQPRRATFRTPFKHPTFAPGTTDVFEERWGVVRDWARFEAALGATGRVERAERAPADFDWTTAYGLYRRGEQALREREDRTAEDYLRKALAKESCFVPALNALAELEYRRGHDGACRTLCAKALSVDAYDAAANYLDGLCALSRNDVHAALERLGLAAYSPLFRAAAHAKMSKGYLRLGDPGRALAQARKCREANANSIDGYALSILALRACDEGPAAAALLREACAVWPLSRIIRSLVPDSAADGSVAFWYLDCGLRDEAIRHFKAGGSFLDRLMACYLACDTAALDTIAEQSIRFVFPCGREFVAALDWAKGSSTNWKFVYLRAVLAASLGDDGLADRLLDSIQEADDMVFYLYRASRRTGCAALRDLVRAADLEDSWRVGRAKMCVLAELGDWREVQNVGADYLRRYPRTNQIQIPYANALLKLKDYEGCVRFLDGVSILPSEFGDNATDIYQAAERALGREKTWPEHLGKGKPLD